MGINAKKVKKIVDKKLENIELSENNISALLDFVMEICDDDFDYMIYCDDQHILIDDEDKDYEVKCSFKGFLSTLWMDVVWATSTPYEDENQDVLRKLDELKLDYKMI